MEDNKQNPVEIIDERQTKQLIKRPLTKLKLVVFLLIGLAVAVAAVGGYQIYKHYNNKPDNKQGRPYSQDYKNLEAYTLDSWQPETAINFKKPPEFKKARESIQPGYSSVSLVDYSEASQTKTGLGYINADVIHNTLASTPDYRQKLKKYLNEPNSQEYQQFSEPLRQYITDSLPGHPKAVTAEIAPFTNSNIKDFAWQLNFYTLSDGNRSTVLQGKVIFLAGEKSFYYFMLSTVGYNWAPNQAIWQQMVDSLKIDQ